MPVRSFVLLTGLSFLLVGCEQTTVSGTRKKLTLKKPADQTLVRGKTNEVRVAVERAGFSGPVTLEFGQLPKGVQVTPADQKVAADADSAVCTLHADPTADLVVNQNVTVTAKTMPDLQATETFKLTVKD